MGTYQSKYTGAEIDSKLDAVGQIASEEQIGGIKVGEGLDISEEGVLSVLSGGSDYTEVELLSTPKEFSVTGSGWMAIRQNIELLESIENYDEIVFTADLLDNTYGYTSARQIPLKVSNIVYNTSDDIVDNNSHLAISFGMAAKLYDYIGWFKTGTTFRVLGLNFYNVGGSSVTHSKVRIRSIKGIKY